MRNDSPLYVILEDDPSNKEPLVIRDVGPWTQRKSVTNRAEEVVATLVRQGRLPPGRRLLYWDSESELGEILIKDAKFAGFAPAPRDRQEASTCDG